MFQRLANRAAVTAQGGAAKNPMKKERSELKRETDGDPNLPVGKKTLRNGKFVGPFQCCSETPSSQRPREQGKWRQQRRRHKKQLQA
jgi:hypothetical protein